MTYSFREPSRESFPPSQSPLVHLTLPEPDCSPEDLTQGELPIVPYLPEILEALETHRVVGVVGETGSGKTKMVGQYFLDYGNYDQIFHLVPRRVLAESMAGHICETRGETLGDLIGYRTAREGEYGDNTRLLFMTDGLELKQLLHEIRTGDAYRKDSRTLIIVDEVHEWNVHIEYLVGLVRLLVEEEGRNDFIISSATMPPDLFTEGFPGAKEIRFPGRQYPIETISPEPGADLVEYAMQFFEKGWDIQIIEAGKADINQTILELKNRGFSGKVFPVHALLSAEEQREWLQCPEQCIGVATNVVGIGVTRPRPLVVLDRGYHKRPKLVEGVERLCMISIDAATEQQNKGRAGRTAPGVYMNFNPDSFREPFAEPEILHAPLETETLRLLLAGLDPRAFNQYLVHPAPEESLDRAFETLHALDCIDDDGNPTKIGEVVGRMPVSVRGGRMLVEAKSYGVVKDVIPCVAILESGGFIDSRLRSSQWRQLCAGEKGCDLFAQSIVLRDAENFREEWLRNYGINKVLFRETIALRDHITEALELRKWDLGGEGGRAAVVRSIIAGLKDNLFEFRGNGFEKIRVRSVWDQAHLPIRRLDRYSVIESAAYLVGLPYDIEIADEGDRQIVERKILHGTVVNRKGEIQDDPGDWRSKLNRIGESLAD